MQCQSVITTLLLVDEEYRLQFVTIDFQSLMFNGVGPAMFCICIKLLLYFPPLSFFNLSASPVIALVLFDLAKLHFSAESTDCLLHLNVIRSCFAVHLMMLFCCSFNEAAQ